MQKIKQVLKEYSNRLIKKSFWMPASLGDKIKKEASRPEWPSESALVRHIINNWFQK